MLHLNLVHLILVHECFGIKRAREPKIGEPELGKIPLPLSPFLVYLNLVHLILVHRFFSNFLWLTKILSSSKSREPLNHGSPVTHVPFFVSCPCTGKTWEINGDQNKFSTWTRVQMAKCILKMTLFYLVNGSGY